MEVRSTLAIGCARRVTRLFARTHDLSMAMLRIDIDGVFSSLAIGCARRVTRLFVRTPDLSMAMLRIDIDGVFSSLAIGSVVGTAGTLYTGTHAPANATKPPRRHFRSAAEMRPRSVALAQLPSSSCAFSTRATLPAANILPLSPRARSLHSLPRPLHGLYSTLRCSC